MHNNAPFGAHHIVNDFWQQRDTHMDWPARSLDFNPSEHHCGVSNDERQSIVHQQLTLTTCSTSCRRTARLYPRTTDLHYLDCQFRAKRRRVKFIACRRHFELLTSGVAVGIWLGDWPRTLVICSDEFTTKKLKCQNVGHCKLRMHMCEM